MAAKKSSALKKKVHDLIDHLPNNRAMKDIRCQLDLMKKLRRSENALKRGGIAHEEIRKRVASLDNVILRVLPKDLASIDNPARCFESTLSMTGLLNQDCFRIVASIP